MLDLFIYSMIGGVFSLLGGILLLIRPQLTHRFSLILVSFGAGAFLAAAFLDILPEALELSPEPHPILLTTLIGFLAFFALERFLMRYLHSEHGHEHHEHTETLAFLLILGDSLHNFLDGVAIAIAYVANPVLGLPTSLAIAAHEIPQEIGDFSILLKLGWSKSRVVGINIAQSLLTLPGVLLGLFLSQQLSAQLPYLLAATAGIFIYISASDLIPQLHHEAGHKHFGQIILPMLTSIVLIYTLVYLTHS